MLPSKLSNNYKKGIYKETLNNYKIVKIFKVHRQVSHREKDVLKII